MIPALLRLPAVPLEPDGLAELAGLVAALSRRWCVLVGPARTAAGSALDEFTLATALAVVSGTRVGVAATLDAGRAPGIVAREATTSQLLGACEVLLLEGPVPSCRDAAKVVGALFTPGAHTVTTPTASVTGAVNDPVPDVDGGPAVLWREGADLCRLVGGEPDRVGGVLDVAPGDPLPAPEPATLVVPFVDGMALDELAAALRA
jgi:hypothetical protein